MSRITRARLRQSSPSGLTTIFEGDSLDSIQPSIDAATELKPGAPFIIEMDLRLPVARAFDLAGAESIFRSKMPPGIDLLDVHSSGSRRVIVQARVQSVQAQDGYAASAAIVLAAIGAFIAAHWVAISLLSIGVFVSLAFLVTAIRGKSITVSSPIGEVADLLKWGAIAAVVVWGIKQFGGIGIGGRRAV